MAVISKAHDCLKKVSPTRAKRIVDEVLPLVAEGLTSTRIAEKLNISQSQANLDIQKAKEIWKEEYVQSRVEDVRGEAIARVDYIFAEAMQAWSISKMQGSPIAKYLDTAIKCVGDKVKYSGAEIDLKVIQQNVNVSMASAEQVMQTFEPMSSADFKAFASAHAEAQLKAAEASKAILPASSAPMTDESVIDTDDGQWLDEDAADDKPQGKNRRVQHPFR